MYLCFIISVFFLYSATSFQLTVIHTNDVHAHYEEMNKYGGLCSDPDGKCYGGMARLKTKVDEIRSMYPNSSLLLDAGDQYQGTLWFTQHGGAIVRTYMNLLGYDAMALGNHEFDNGVSGMLPLFDSNNFTVLSCNIDARNEPTVQNKFSKHVIISIGGEQVGIIGYTTKNTPTISKPGNLIFSEEIESIRAEVSILKNKDINKIIALGHSGFTVDKNIALNVEGIDLVIGGHTNTFLYTGEAPSNEKPVNVYPTVITQSNGDKVLVVQDYTFAKYLGFLQVEFDNSGKMTSYSGNPILLDYTVQKDEAVQNVTDELGIEVNKMMKDVIGRSLVFLNGERSTCRKEECNMGNVVADGLVHQNLLHADSVDGTKVFISIVNSGSIRGSIQPGNITVGDAFTTQPFRNTVETIKLRGEYLLQALERSVEEFDPVDPGGQFLQFSGIKVKYDLSKPPLQRVVEAYAICQNCTVPAYEKIDKGQKYSLILSNFVLKGGDGYDMISKYAEQSHTIGDLDSDVLIEYIKNVSPIYHGLEGRIEFITDEDTNGSTSKHNNGIHLIYILCILCMFIREHM